MPPHSRAMGFCEKFARKLAWIVADLSQGARPRMADAWRALPGAVPENDTMYLRGGNGLPPG